MLKNNWAAGICRIPSETLKAGCKTILMWLIHINAASIWEKLPDDWSHGMAILTFWKRKGDRLHSKLTFMPSRSTLDQIFTSHRWQNSEASQHTSSLRRLDRSERCLRFRGSHIRIRHKHCAILTKVGVTSVENVRSFKKLCGGSPSCVRINDKLSVRLWGSSRSLQLRHWWSDDSGQGANSSSFLQGCQGGPFLAKFQKSELFSSWMAKHFHSAFWLFSCLVSSWSTSKKSFGLLAFSWIVYAAKDFTIPFFWQHFCKILWQMVY